ncbi:uro-adherence factor A-like isoform X2 [Ptychodera flava]|uniref:uro-adherence factor A-like isoform X2 n=1 Tax=Ptychodera flava TaxID=63121 RepID=UPI003969C153
MYGQQNPFMRYHMRRRRYCLSHASPDQREQLADQLEQRHNTGQRTSRKQYDSVSSLESCDFHSSSTSSDTGNISLSQTDSRCNSRTSSRKVSRTDSAGFESTGILNVIEENMDVFADGTASADRRVNEQQHSRRESEDSMYSVMSSISFDDELYDRRTCEIQADVGDNDLEEIEKLTKDGSSVTQTSDSEDQPQLMISGEPMVVVTDTEETKRSSAEKDQDGGNEITDSKQTNKKSNKGRHNASSGSFKAKEAHVPALASPQQLQPCGFFAPRTLFEQLLDYKHRQGKLSPESSTQLPFESDYEYMLRMRRMSPKGVFSRATSLDSSGSSVSDYLLDSMDLTPTEDILMNLGFGGNNFAVPERFVRPWYEKLQEARIREVQELGNSLAESGMTACGNMRKHANNADNKENEPVRGNVEGENQKKEAKMKSLEQKDVTKEEKKSAFKTVKSNDLRKKLPPRKRQLIRAATVSSLGSSSDLPESVSTKDSKTHNKSHKFTRLDIFDQEKVAKLEHMQDKLKERRRKQFARQKSLPACLETLTEEEESQAAKSPNVPKDKRLASFFQTIEKSSSVDRPMEDQGICKEQKSVDPQQEQYMLAVKCLVDSKDSGFETGAAMSDNSRQTSPHEQEVCTQTSEGSISPLVKLSAIEEDSVSLQPGAEQEIMTESDNELLDREVAGIVHNVTDSHTQTDSEVGSPSLSPLCRLEPVMELTDQETITDVVPEESEAKQSIKCSSDLQHRNPRIHEGLGQESKDSVSSVETMIDASRSHANQDSRNPILEEIESADELDGDQLRNILYDSTNHSVTLNTCSQTDISLPANILVGLMIQNITDADHSVDHDSRTSRNVSRKSSISHLDFYNSVMNAMQMEFTDTSVSTGPAFLDDIGEVRVNETLGGHTDFDRNLHTFSSHSDEFTSDFVPLQTQGDNLQYNFSHSSGHLLKNPGSLRSIANETPISRYFSSLPREFRGREGTVLMPNEHLELFPNGRVCIMENDVDRNRYSGIYAREERQSIGAMHVCQDCDEYSMQRGHCPHHHENRCQRCGQPIRPVLSNTSDLLQLEHDIPSLQYEEYLERLSTAIVNSTLEKVTSELKHGVDFSLCVSSDSKRFSVFTDSLSSTHADYPYKNILYQSYRVEACRVL